MEEVEEVHYGVKKTDDEYIIEYKEYLKIMNSGWSQSNKKLSLMIGSFKVRHFVINVCQQCVDNASNIYIVWIEKKKVWCHSEAKWGDGVFEIFRIKVK